MTDALTISARYNGPPGTGNGGYTCGLVAGLVDSDVVQVSLRAPPPLERPLTVARDAARVELTDGNTLVAEGQPAELVLDAPGAVAPDELTLAVARGRERWFTGHPFPTCFVCGPERADDDSMQMFPARLPDRATLFGALWRPSQAFASNDGSVQPEFVWAALDCASSAPVANFGAGPPMVLARMTARLGCSVRAGEPHSILSWPLARDGRKREAAAALYDEQGRMLCASKALWIELRQPS